MKAPEDKEKKAKLIAKLELDLEILTHQETLWRLRAKKKRQQIVEVTRQISTHKRKKPE